jgi:hypothetical protein
MINIVIPRDIRELSDDVLHSGKVDLVAQGFREAGFQTRFDTFNGGYDVMGSLELGNHGHMKVDCDERGVKVVIGSSNTAGYDVALEAMRYAGVRGRVEHR